MAVYESPGAGRVLIAGGSPLAAEPTWTRYDNAAGVKCSGFDWNRGRQSEFDVTNTGTARVRFSDTNGTFTSGFVGNQIMLQLHDPVASEWQPVFRGHIEDIHYTPNPGNQSLVETEIECVDIFDYLGGAKFVVGVMGDALPSGMSGVVFYEDGPVDDRVTALLDDAGLASAMYVVFTGNVDVNETLYDPDDVILRGLREAADAEFPGIANVYVDRYGRVAFHGRFARFDPDTVAAGASTGAWEFTRWDAATWGNTTDAQIRELVHNKPRTRIVNTFVAWPREDETGVTFDQTNTASLVKTDSTSISAYGYRGLEKPDLIIKAHKTNGNTGADECGLFGDFFVTSGNYTVPRDNIERAVFRSIQPDDPRAAATWGLMTGVDISDVIAIGGADYYVEGVSGECQVANASYDDVTVIPNLSPASYYTDNVFEEA